MPIVKPLILGANGNMGLRYQAILKHLGVSYAAVDDGDEVPADFDGVLIATPTALHRAHIDSFAAAGVPILCEKPIATNMADVTAVINTCEKHGTCLAMVDQYAELTEYGTGPTSYNYFRHGADGMYWDCINIIGHARGTVSIKETSPIWTCTINGHPLSLADMDMAYVSMIRHWLDTPRERLDYIYRAHSRVANLVGAQ